MGPDVSSGLIFLRKKKKKKDWWIVLHKIKKYYSSKEPIKSKNVTIDISFKEFYCNGELGKRYAN